MTQSTYSFVPMQDFSKPWTEIVTSNAASALCMNSTPEQGPILSK